MKTTESTLRKMLLEIALGGDPTAGVSGRDDKQAGVSTNVIVPVEPSIESPIQLSSRTPAIEDESYAPSNNLELGRAISKIGELVPNEAVEEFYVKVKELYIKITGQEIA
jgi:hypothetical protein